MFRLNTGHGKPITSTSPFNQMITKRTALALSLILTFIASAPAALLFNTAASWKYRKGTAEASAPDTTAWRGVSFDDATFTTAPAPFWYGDVLPGGTQLTDM